MIATGESVTVPTGRMAVLPNLQVDGELVIDGEVFVPSGATVGDLEDQIAAVDDRVDNVYTKTEVDNKPTGFKNLIINGGFDVWQRGTSSSITTVSNTYTADRFQTTLNQVSSGTLMVAQNTVHKEVGNNYCLELNAQSLVTTNVLDITQIIESSVAKKLAGKTVTLSVRAKVLSGTANCSINIIEGTNIDSYPNGTTFNSNVNITTSYQTFTMQATISQTTTSLAFRLTTPSAFNGVLYIQNVQLEEGSVATPFENRPYGDELARCQRYYEIGQSKLYINASATGLTISTQFKISKRTSPTITVTSGVYQPTSIEGVYIEGFTSYRNTGNEQHFSWSALAEL